jgi:hypothetical protein
VVLTDTQKEAINQRCASAQFHSKLIEKLNRLFVLTRPLFRIPQQARAPLLLKAFTDFNVKRLQSTINAAKKMLISHVKTELRVSDYPVINGIRNEVTKIWIEQEKIINNHPHSDLELMQDETGKISGWTIRSIRPSFSYEFKTKEATTQGKDIHEKSIHEEL